MDGVRSQAPMDDDRPIRFRGRIRETLKSGRFSIGQSPLPRAASFVARKTHGRAFEVGEVVDLLGFPVNRADGVQFEVTDFRWLGLPGDTPLPEQGIVQLTNYVGLAATIAHINSLSDAQVSRGWPARLDGFVSHLDEQAGVFYLQRGAWEGIRVAWRGTNAMPGRLQKIRLDGRTIPGVRTPWLTADSFRSVSDITITEPKQVRVEAFQSGRHTGAFLKLGGVVRSVDLTEDGAATLRVSSQGEIFEARVNLHSGKLPGRLVDAEVTLTGVAEAREGRLTSFPKETLLVQGPEDLQVTMAAPARPYAMRRSTVADVVGQSRIAPRIHRVRVKGVVTYVAENRAGLDDGSAGIELRSHEPLDLKLKDEIDALGFSGGSYFMPRLEDIEFRKLGAAELPPAMEITAAEVLSGDVNGRRIKLRGTVVGRSAFKHGRVELSGEGAGFTAELPDAFEFASEMMTTPGSVIEVVGVCQYLSLDDNGDSRTPDAFRVLLADADAAILIEPPSWWTEERSVAVAGGLMLLALAAAGWAAFLGSRVAQNRAQFLTAFHANPMPAWIVRVRDWSCLEANPEFETLFGWSREEVAGRTMAELDLWANATDLRDFLSALENDPSQRAGEARMKSRDGRSRSVLLSTEPVATLGEPALLILAYDVTARLKLLAELRQAQKMEAVGQLAAGIAHDFNNLLTVICGNLGLVEMKTNLDPDTQTLVDGIDEAAQRASDLTHQLLAFSRKSIMRLEAKNLNDIVQSSAMILQRTLGETIEIHCSLAQGELTVECDSGLLSQAMLNLGLNARDAMPEGGALTLTTSQARLVPEDLRENADAKPGDYAVVEVGDTGCGMTEAVRAKAFEPFFTTKDVGKGTGLGLSTTYGIVRQHDGWIDLESSPGKGARFRIHLPLSRMTSGIDRAARERGVDVERGAETILLVEDEPPVRKTVARTLRSLGYETFEAGNGNEAEAIWKEHGDRIDLVLTDLVMPSGKSGFDVARELRKDRPDLKVIYMTGHSSELLEHAGSLVRGVDFLPKPFPPHELSRMIRNRLDANGG